MRITGSPCATVCWSTARSPPDPASATVTVKLASKFRLLSAAFGDFTSPGLELSGDETALQSLLGVLDAPDPSFNIVTP